MQIFKFEDKYNNLDRQFGDYVKGKRIAVVGRSALDNLEQGSFIDSHDVVVRIHEVIPYAGFTSPMEWPEWKFPPFVPTEWHTRIGRRTNVFYHKVFHASVMEQLLPAFRHDGGDFLCHEYLENLWYYGCCGVRKVAPCRYLTNDHFLNTMEVVKYPPYSGSLVIADILRHDIESLYFTGFPTFFDRTGELLPDKWIQENRDKNFMNLKWLRSLYESHEAITTDNNMLSLFDSVPRDWSVQNL